MNKSGPTVWRARGLRRFDGSNDWSTALRLWRRNDPAVTGMADGWHERGQCGG